MKSTCLPCCYFLCRAVASITGVKYDKKIRWNCPYELVQHFPLKSLRVFEKIPFNFWNDTTSYRNNYMIMLCRCLCTVCCLCTNSFFSVCNGENPEYVRSYPACWYCSLHSCFHIALYKTILTVILLQIVLHDYPE